jgi:hypothetical protein
MQIFEISCAMDAADDATLTTAITGGFSQPIMECGGLLKEESVVKS